MHAPKPLRPASAHELIGDGVTGDGDTADSGIGRNRADGDTVTTNAGVALEDDVTALVDGETVILVMNRTDRCLSAGRLSMT